MLYFQAFIAEFSAFWMIVTVMSVYKVFSLVLLAMLMQACGQTGPLYMPDDSKPPVYVPKQTPIEEDK